MKTSYQVIITGDQVTWLGDRPDATRPMRGTVQLLPDGTDGRLLAALCEDIARKTGGITSIPDSVAWQREQRIDRPMPGREP